MSVSKYLLEDLNFTRLDLRTVNCAIRGAYVYQNASLQLVDCIVSGTRSTTTPAVHAQRLGPGCPTLKLIRCSVHKNGGPGVVVEGSLVDFSSEGGAYDSQIAFVEVGERPPGANVQEEHLAFDGLVLHPGYSKSS